jgi:hypothetical protein
VPCLLNFDTFILRFTEYFNSIRQANESPDYSALALVKVVIQLKPGGTMDEAFNQVMKTICASVHKDELCGKYSESVLPCCFTRKARLKRSRKNPYSGRRLIIHSKRRLFHLCRNRVLHYAGLRSQPRLAAAGRANVALFCPVCREQAHLPVYAEE